MIINLNVRKDSTMKDLAHIAGQISNDFQEELSTDGNTCFKELIVFSMLATNLSSMYIVNTAMQEAQQNPVVGREIAKQLSLDIIRNLEACIEFQFRQIEEGCASRVNTTGNPPALTLVQGEGNEQG